MLESHTLKRDLLASLVPRLLLCGPCSSYAGERKKTESLVLRRRELFNVNVIGMMIFDVIVTLSSMCHVT